MISILKLSVYSSLIIYIVSAALYFTGIKISKVKLLSAAMVLAVTGAIFNLGALSLRTIMSGRLPLASGYEFLLSFAWITVVLYLTFEYRSKIRTAGGIVMLIAAGLILSVILIMKGQFGEVSHLMPALKSPWLTSHVLTATVAYACFTLAAGLAFMDLIKKDSSIAGESVCRIVAVGFLMLSVSIVLGAVWAEQAWGSYWSWDPKEDWALITWIIYAVYLHLHRKRGWRGRNASLMVVAGFVLVLFTFFGVNYLFSGLHSYA